MGRRPGRERGVWLLACGRETIRYDAINGRLRISLLYLACRLSVILVNLSLNMHSIALSPGS